MDQKEKTEVRINGQLYRLRFDLWAMEQIEEKFGGIRQAFAAMDSGKMVSTVRTMFAIMANCQRNCDGMPEDVTGNEIGKHESIRKLREVSEAIKAAVAEGMHSETMDGGEASDKKQNPLDKEYEEKNG